MISLTNVTKIYASGRSRVTALEKTDLSVHAGEFVVIIGRSGAGKSTLLGILGGLLQPTTGDVQIKGQSLWALDVRARARQRARDMGFVFQNASVIQSLSLLENVMLATFFTDTDSKGVEDRARLLLDQVGLADRANAYPYEISGGEKRRVAVASALMNTPSLLLADEPTGELDRETEIQIMERLKVANDQGTTVFMVTHNQQLSTYAHRTLTMDQGRLQEQGGA